MSSHSSLSSIYFLELESWQKLAPLNEVQARKDAAEEINNCLIYAESKKDIICLKLSYLPISSLPNLSNTPITHLQLLGSNCIELNSLDLPKKLRVIELGNCELLQKIDFHQLNSLERIFVGKCAELQKVNCSNLSSLDTLTIHSNLNLEELNISNCNYLHKIEIDSNPCLHIVNLTEIATKGILYSTDNPLLSTFTSELNLLSWEISEINASQSKVIPKDIESLNFAELFWQENPNKTDTKSISFSYNPLKCLNAVERQALLLYTDNKHKDLNPKKLSEEKLPLSDQLLDIALTSALKKIKSNNASKNSGKFIPKKTFRGAKSGMTDKVKEGEDFTYPAYLSTSTSINIAKKFLRKPDANKLLAIFGKSGADISSASFQTKSDYDEFEVLYPPNTKFTMLIKAKNAQGKFHMILEEYGMPSTTKKFRMAESLLDKSITSKHTNKPASSLVDALIDKPIKNHKDGNETFFQKTLSSTASQNTRISTAETLTAKLEFNYKEINDWLFNGVSNSKFPPSKLKTREAEKYAPKIYVEDMPMLGSDKYSCRIGIYTDGLVTNFKSKKGTILSIGTSNNGDLLTGCGYKIATAVINAAGAGLQMDLYNQYGVPGVMDQPEFAKTAYAHTEGRGYSITCNAHDMQKTHNVKNIELMTVPMYDSEGILNMYREALAHSKDADYIVLPRAGMTHPVLTNQPELSAQIATRAAKEFIDLYPDSRLKIIFTVVSDKQEDINLYREHALKLHMS